MDFSELANWMVYLYPFHMGRIYKNNKCNICGEIFSDPYNRDQHNKNKHKSTMAEQIINENEIYESDIECEYLQLTNKNLYEPKIEKKRNKRDSK